MRKMLAMIPSRKATEAAKAAEKAAAADCPTGRIEITGKVLTIKSQETMYGWATKMLVEHATGFKVWGTLPSNLTVEKGDTVAFTAMVEPSKDDAKFGFYSRPTKARVVVATAVENV
jgi:hypothetical protein